MQVIATAGHVDHGKSRLVQALTGIDPDRLEEEKRRGLTIDLGFAWLRLPSGGEVGIVDVPGHERFIKNMLAGVGAVGAALFVVAANEGWKPQSQEHLDILDLLAVRAAVAAVTKSDLVDEARVAAVLEQVAAKLSETSLAGSPVLSVSAETGEGLDELVREIDVLVSRMPATEDGARPRLWVDRIFSMHGSGTVVTGTLVGGGLAEQEEVEVLPGGSRARIRGIQTHRRRVAQIGPGNRTALNLTGSDLDQIRRGDVAARPGSWRPTSRLLASFRFLPHLDHDPTEKGAFKFHAGSAERDAGMRFLDEPPQPGEDSFVLIDLDEAIVSDFKDRFVLRDAGRRETVGGGIVLEPHPSLRSRVAMLGAARRRAAVADRRGYLSVLIEEEGILPRADVPVRAGVADIPSNGGIWLTSVVLSPSKFEEIASRLIGEIRQHQANHPLEPGLPRARGLVVAGLNSRAFDEVVEEMEARDMLVADSTALRTPDHRPTVGGPDAERLLAAVDTGGLSPPSIPELETEFDPALIRALIRSGRLTQVSPSLVYAPARLAEIEAMVRDRIGGAGPMTVAEFRDLAGTTRKYAVPLLEYLDQSGFTRRQGDTRVLGPRATS
jgi:selenocysteine-specific elongation factor